MATNASRVAISGAIMPAPLAIPVTVTGVPPIDTVTALVLGTVSVVMMARAAARPAVIGQGLQGTG